MRNKMDDKYAKEYNKKKEHLRNEQFKKYKDQEEWHHNQVNKLKKQKPGVNPILVGYGESVAKN